MIGTPPERLSACDKCKDFFRKGNDNTACYGKETVGSLGRVVRFERKADLNDTEAEENQTDSADQSENKIGQIIDDRQRIVIRCIRRHRNNADYRYHDD